MSVSDVDNVDAANLPVKLRKKRPPLTASQSQNGARTAVSHHFRQSYIILKNIIFPTNKTPESNPLNPRHTAGSEVSVNVPRQRHDPFAYLTIKILFWDIFISIMDTISDFAQGLALFSTPEKKVYGLVTLAINWIPGFPAAVHLISMYRTEFPWYTTLIYAGLLIVFYPIVPTLAFLNVLWLKPSSRISRSEEFFRDAEYRSVIAHSISGCIESSIQLIYQMWLVLNGVVLLRWDEISSLTITDWEGNTLFLPIATSVCMIFSVVAIIKASIEANLIRVHFDGLSSWKSLIRFVPIMLDHLPVLISGAFFRISSLILIMTYLNSFGFIPIIIFFVVNIIAMQAKFGSSEEKIPIWIIGFISIFLPIFQTIEIPKNKIKRAKMISEQYRVFFMQSVTALVCYGSSLIAITVMINKTDSDFKYNPDVVLSNWNFKLCIYSVLAMGLMATILAWFAPASSLFHRIARRKGEEQVDGRGQQRLSTWKTTLRQLLTILWCIVILGLAVAPVISVLIIHFVTPDQGTMTSYFFFKPHRNVTKIVQATTLRGFDRIIFGTTKDLLQQGIENEFDEDGLKVVNSQPTTDVDFKTASKRASHDIVLISRALWELKDDQIVTNMDPLAVVITDSERLRPSSPLPDLGNVAAHIPIILVRVEDQEELPHEGDSFPVWISPNNNSIPDPEWACQLPYGRSCLPPVFNEEGYIVGYQTRKKECHWGGHACVGYTNVPEERPYCNGPEIEVCPPKPYQDMGNFKVYEFQGGQKRILRFRPITVTTKLNGLLEECDRGTTVWTKWLEWFIDGQERDIIYRSRRRYCYIRHEEALLEERMTDICCDIGYDSTVEDNPFTKPICKNDPSVPRC